jgi:hypothetical protein
MDIPATHRERRLQQKILFGEIESNINRSKEIEDSIKLLRRQQMNIASENVKKLQQVNIIGEALLEDEYKALKEHEL